MDSFRIVEAAGTAVDSVPELPEDTFFLWRPRFQMCPRAEIIHLVHEQMRRNAKRK